MRVISKEAQEAFKHKLISSYIKNFNKMDNSDDNYFAFIIDHCLAKQF